MKIHEGIDIFCFKIMQGWNTFRCLQFQINSSYLSSKSVIMGGNVLDNCFACCG
jgi:hypothetical protein